MLLIYNDIDITVTSPLDQGDVSDVKSIRLDYTNIVRMVVRKSYDTHITEVELELENLLAGAVALLTSGGALLHLNITSGPAKDSAFADSLGVRQSSNIFVVEEIQMLDSDPGEKDFAGGLILAKAKLRLKSWTLTRMLSENSFGFTSTGTAVAASSSPRDYLLSVLQPEFMKTYTPEGALDPENIDGANPTEIVASPGEWFSIQEDSTNLSKIVTTAPTTGYIFQEKNNFKILEEFFKQYPVFLTPYGWLIDDLPVSGDVPTQIVVTDFLVSTSWKISSFISSMLNNTTESSKSMARYFNLTQIGIRPFFNKAKFASSVEEPMIQLIQAQAGIPTIVDGSMIQKKVDRFVTDGKSLYSFTMPNPTVKKIYTFMTENDILSQLSFLRKYKDQNPLLESFLVSNIAYHSFDIREALLKKGTNVIQDKDTIENTVDRIGPLYRCEFIFERHNERQLSEIFTQLLNSESTEVKTFKCSANLEYLMTNSIPAGQIPTLLDISKELGELADNVIETIASGSVTINGVLYGNSTPYMGAIEIKGEPGDIAKTAEALINKKFKYVWGGSGPTYYDCSGFVMEAVCAATGLKKWGSSKSKDAFPKKSSYQAAWCQRYAQPVGYDDVEPGDLIFLSQNRSISGVFHVGIAKSKTEVFASSSSNQPGPKKPADQCTASAPCKGAVVQNRYVGGEGAPRKSFWDRNFLAAYRIVGHGTQDQPAIPGQGVGIMCQEIAKIESSGLGGDRPEGYAAYNESSGARGAYQFLETTKNDYAKAIGLDPNDPAVWTWYNQDAMCAAREKYIRERLTEAGIPTTLRNVYIAWQQGEKGAIEIIKAAETGNEDLLTGSRISNMKNNMHGGVYTGVKSYIEDTERFIQEKGIDPSILK